MMVFGLDEETETRLIGVAAERLAGKGRAMAIIPYLDMLEAEARPLREKLVLATYLGAALAK